MIYSRTMSAKSSFATARLDDAAAIAEFLSGIPNGEELGKVLQNRQAVSSRAYDDETWTARLVDSDGRVVRCFAVDEARGPSLILVRPRRSEEHTSGLQSPDHLVCRLLLY